MNKISKPILFMACIFLLSACSMVYSPKPMGEAPVVLKADSWDGNWIHPEGVIAIKVTDSRKGEMEISFVDDGAVEKHSILIKKSGDWVFGSLKEENELPRYLWARLKKEGNQLLVWTPDSDKFKHLIEKKIIPGSLDSDGNIVLGELSSDNIKSIASSEHGVLFDWDEPMVLFRVFQK